MKPDDVLSEMAARFPSPLIAPDVAMEDEDADMAEMIDDERRTNGYPWFDEDEYEGECGSTGADDNGEDAHGTFIGYPF